MKLLLVHSLCFVWLCAVPVNAADEDVRNVRAGKLEIIQNTDYTRVVRLNGKAILMADDPIAFDTVERVKGLEFVVLAESQGNSGISYQVIVIDAQGNTKILKDHDLFSPGKIKIQKTSDGVELDFGYEMKKRKVFAVQSDGASVHSATMKLKQVANSAAGLKVSDCLWVYENAIDACIHAKSYGDNGCRDPEKTWAQVTARGIHAMGNVPGFNRARFSNACVSACKDGKRPNLDDFSQSVCGIR